MGKITLLLQGSPPREIPLDKPRISIGRRSRNDIRIDDQAVSGEHAILLRVGDDAVLEDLDSTNGTRVNGQPVKKHFLQDGDVVEVASHRFVYHASPLEPALPPAVPVLEVASGNNAGRRTLLNKAITVIGGIGEPGLLILRRGRDYVLVSEPGSRGVIINGGAMPPEGWRLGHGDRIQLTGADLHFLHPAS
ncbi:FHA domain-containing protein [Noviherbaspirillum aridicola]|uniref:FHA domain-containing protein n=1 Tax=Noviherbaspirillum aridicola TaxID=2849687 RepID=A0ABQ4Q7P8_9BURK|nr:FHA domain-containing protein [Noviherbaspirillum aridicola]GIZ53208.1 hypothetical protein NCCP691_32220 [Noviherbaspirillum aridicola]